MTEVSTRPSTTTTSPLLNECTKKLKKRNKRPKQIRHANPELLSESLISIRSHKKSKVISKRVSDVPTRGVASTVDISQYANEIKLAWNQIQENLNTECRVLKDAIIEYLNLRVDSCQLGDLIANPFYECAF